MAKRIYALAKELNLESKELVEICPKAGVDGKSSALASLSEEEVEQIKSFLTKASSKPKVGSPTSPSAPAGPLRREDYVNPAGDLKKPPLLGKKSAKPAKPEAAKPDAEEKQAEEPEQEKAEPKPEAAKKAEPKPAEVKKAEPKKAEPKKAEPKKAEPKSPAIRLAKLPDAPAPKKPAAASSNEPAPQKPDLKLPLDAIRQGKAGTKPLQDHIRKHEAKRKAEADGTKKPAAPAPAAAGDSVTSRRRGKKSADKPFDDMLGGREARQLARKRTAASRGKQRSLRDDDSGQPSHRRRIHRKKGVNTAAPRKGKVIIHLPATIRSFSAESSVPANQLLLKLMTQFGTNANINSEIDDETAQLLAVELGVDAEFRQAVSLEVEVLSQFEDDAEETLRPRAPVVTFLGHVDHGKTSLLDRIIGTDVVSGESGGITQHIRAYEVDHNGRSITFVDTPGHEAFTEMRARGANVTDIAVLVVAADDGVMPQTEEAISHARAAEVPIVIALNKVDLPGLNEDRVMQQLAAADLLPTQWGGEIEMIKCSALKGTGIDELLETLATVAELHELTANPDRKAMGTCLEAELHEGYGVVAKFLVQKGTLKVGDVVVCGNAHGRIRAMHNTLRPNERIEQAGPSTPVNIHGLDVAPGAGEHFYVLDDISEAREIAERRSDRTKAQELTQAPRHISLETLFETLEAQETQTLNLILRADTKGSIEAIKKELTKLEHPEVQIKLLQATVGGISEADVHLADASDGVIIGFNVVPDENARVLADKRGIQIRRYDVIYEITDHLRKALEGKLKPEEREVDLGHALVQKVFTISKIGSIAGCRILSGAVERNARTRVIRESRIIGDYPIESLRREKDDVREVREGYECGIRLGGFNDLKEGDVLEAYRKEEVARTL